jgi:hypothetical protein
MYVFENLWCIYAKLSSNISEINKSLTAAKRPLLLKEAKLLNNYCPKITALMPMPGRNDKQHI